MAEAHDIFAITLPGLEAVLADEAREIGLDVGAVTPGGVEIAGGWPQVMRANLELRCATRVLWRMGSFMAFHLAQLDKRAKRFDWAGVLDPAIPVRVEVATSRRSKIYHAGAASTRIAGGLEASGFSVTNDAPVTLKIRVDDNRVTVSADTSGEPLHKRGTKQAVGKAPLRETLAASFLRLCGYDGTEPVFDPMCGSGTFVLEAADMAAGLQAGRARSFAFEHFAGFDPAQLLELRENSRRHKPNVQHVGADRDQGVIAMARNNAERAGVADMVSFDQQQMADAVPPSGPPGIVMVNPPYGARIGNKKALYPVYTRLGAVLRQRFAGWRVGIVTSEPSLAKATDLPFTAETAPIAHGGLRIKLYQTGTLGEGAQ
ncbi:MAG: class I SAM-dependent RNA methyltransferase [Pseudomonadota bacterium]